MSPAAAVSSSSSAAVACDADPRFRLDFQRIAHALHPTTLILRKQTAIFFFSNCCPTGRHHSFLVAWPRLFVYAYRSVFAIVT